MAFSDVPFVSAFLVSGSEEGDAEFLREGLGVKRSIVFSTASLNLPINPFGEDKGDVDKPLLSVDPVLDVLVRNEASVEIGDEDLLSVEDVSVVGVEGVAIIVSEVDGVAVGVNSPLEITGEDDNIGEDASVSLTVMEKVLRGSICFSDELEIVLRV